MFTYFICVLKSIYIQHKPTVITTHFIQAPEVISSPEKSFDVEKRETSSLSTKEDKVPMKPSAKRQGIFKVAQTIYIFHHYCFRALHVLSDINSALKRYFTLFNL